MYNDQNITKRETILKGIRFEPELIEKINKMAEESERDFSSQVRFILKEYIRQKETK